MAVIPSFYLLPQRWRWLLLLVASYYFYMQWNVAYAGLLAFSTLVDYVVGRALFATSNSTLKKAILATSLVVNLSLLFTFKYWHLFHHSMAHVFAILGMKWSEPQLNVLLPVGISFYTFQSLSYTIDVFRGVIVPERHLGVFASFVSFFPQLVAGPIERAKNLLPQLNSLQQRFDFDRFCSGAQLILWGLFQKVVVADRLALYVDAVYNHVSEHHGASFLVATYAFAFQIYSDFAGYSNIAIGSARILGIDLMRNFHRPYFAVSVREFWRRWHISLSTWLRDYLYISLGGNRRGSGRTYVNLFITMAVGGFWHGASWNFLIWGALQGIFLIVDRSTESFRSRFSKNHMGKFLFSFIGVALTFHLVCFAWIFFRAREFSDACFIIKSIFTNWGSPLWPPGGFSLFAFGFLVLIGVELCLEIKERFQWNFQLAPMPLRWATWYGLIFLILLGGLEEGSQFIYFQF